MSLEVRGICLLTYCFHFKAIVQMVWCSPRTIWSWHFPSIPGHWIRSAVSCVVWMGAVGGMQELKQPSHGQSTECILTRLLQHSSAVLSALAGKGHLCLAIVVLNGRCLAMDTAGKGTSNVRQCGMIGACGLKNHWTISSG